MTNDNAQAYPLQWPLDRPRNQVRFPARFVTNTRGGYGARRRHSVGQGVETILAELRRMDASSAVISSNVQLRGDGLPRSGQPQPTDPGVAVYFKFERQDVCLACDTWTTVEDNLWAVALTLEAMRGIDRWGAAKLKATFTGYAALPAPAGALWWEVLGLHDRATLEQVRDAYRALARAHHPDAGGTHEEFVRIQSAYDVAMKVRGG